MPEDAGLKQAVFLKSAAGCVLLAILAVLIWFSLHLAAMRIFDADECRNAMMARNVAAGHFGAGDLFPLLLSSMARSAAHSIEILASCRFVMAEIFWLNIFLLALATGERFFSIGGLIALVGAATLAPLWDWGIEIRQENVALALVLLGWCMVRLRKTGTQRGFGVHPLGCSEPISLSQDTEHPKGWTPNRSGQPDRTGDPARCCSVWAMVTFGVMWLVYACVGALVHNFTAPSTNRGDLLKLSAQMPLLGALVAGALIVARRQLISRREAGWVWARKFPELVLLPFGMIMAAIYPTRLNITLVVACGFIGAFRYAADESRQIRNASWAPAVLGLIIFAHLTPFSLAALRHLNYPNARQEGLMRMTENLTDPARDFVFDRSDLVATRPLAQAEAGRDFLIAHRTPVFIRSFRTDDLPESDQAWMQTNYVALADDFWVLGKRLPYGGGNFELIHAGRYRISSMEGSDLAGTYPEGFEGLMTPESAGEITGTLDNVPFAAGTFELQVGTHRLECAANCQTAVVWIGPHLTRIHRLAPGDHEQLFVRNY